MQKESEIIVSKNIVLTLNTEYKHEKQAIEEKNIP